MTVLALADRWFSPEDVRDLHILYDLPPYGLQNEREWARRSIRRFARFKTCTHLI